MVSFTFRSENLNCNHPALWRNWATVWKKWSNWVHLPYLGGWNLLNFVSNHRLGKVCQGKNWHAFFRCGTATVYQQQCQGQVFSLIGQPIPGNATVVPCWSKELSIYPLIPLRRLLLGGSLIQFPKKNRGKQVTWIFGVEISALICTILGSYPWARKPNEWSYLGGFGGAAGSATSRYDFCHDR